MPIELSIFLMIAVVLAIINAWLDLHCLRDLRKQISALRLQLDSQIGSVREEGRDATLMLDGRLVALRKRLEALEARSPEVPPATGPSRAELVAYWKSVMARGTAADITLQDSAEPGAVLLLAQARMHAAEAKSRLVSMGERE